MNKSIIVTLSIGDANNKILELTTPFFKAYSNKIGADFDIISTPIINAHDCLHYEKFQLKRYLTDYERVLYMDSDIVIQAHTPDMFKIVPETHIGAVYDSWHNDSRLTDRDSTTFVWHQYNDMRVLQESFGFINWVQDNINSGVLLFGKNHIKMFDETNLYKKPIRKTFLTDQSLINYNIKRQKLKIFTLDKKFNGTCQNGFSSRPINPHTGDIGENKEEAYCMHFTGDKDKYNRILNQIKKMEK